MNLRLSGWCQSPQGLPGQEAHWLDYQALNSMQEFAEACHALPWLELAVGWSLGGLLLTRALHHGWVKADRLLLIATPWHFVDSQAVEDLAAFSRRFDEQPAATLRHFTRLMGPGAPQSKASDKTRAAYWLEQLGAPAHAPTIPTMLVLGKEDRIVPSTQQNLWRRHAPAVRVTLLEDCGHAPHLQRAEAFAQATRQFSARGSAC